jgi:hypothetical protein
MGLTGDPQLVAFLGPALPAAHALQIVPEVALGTDLPRRSVEGPHAYLWTENEMKTSDAALEAAGVGTEA